MPDLLALVTLIAAAALLAWWSFRASQAKNNFLKWGGAGLAALLSVAVTSVSVIMIVGLFKLHARNAPAPDLKVAGRPEQIQRGQAISDGFCSACHSKTGTLTGGLDIGKDFPVSVGSFVSSNLTPAGQLSHWSDGDIFRAIRNSIDRDGRWLMIMSYTNAGNLSDEDRGCHRLYPQSAGCRKANRESAGSSQPVRGHDAGCSHASGGQADIYRYRHGTAKESHGAVWRIYHVVSGLPRMPRREADGWRARSARTSRTRPEPCKGMEA